MFTPISNRKVKHFKLIWQWEGLSASESWEQNQLIDECKHKPCAGDDI